VPAVAGRNSGTAPLWGRVKAHRIRVSPLAPEDDATSSATCCSAALDTLLASPSSGTSTQTRSRWNRLLDSTVCTVVPI